MYSSVKWARESVKWTNTKYKKKLSDEMQPTISESDCSLHPCLWMDFYLEQQCWLNWASHSLGFGEGIFLLALLLFPPRCFCPVCWPRGFCLLFYCSDSGLWLYLGWNRLPEHSNSKPGKPIFPKHRLDCSGGWLSLSCLVTHPVCWAVAQTEDERQRERETMVISLGGKNPWTSLPTMIWKCPTAFRPHGQQNWLASWREAQFYS